MCESWVIQRRPHLRLSQELPWELAQKPKADWRRFSEGISRGTEMVQSPGTTVAHRLSESYVGSLCGRAGQQKLSQVGPGVIAISMVMGSGENRTGRLVLPW